MSAAEFESTVIESATLSRTPKLIKKILIDCARN
jgi:hypothetical protein